MLRDQTLMYDYNRKLAVSGPEIRPFETAEATFLLAQIEAT